VQSLTVSSRLLPAALAHGPGREAAALAASLAKGVRQDIAVRATQCSSAGTAARSLAVPSDASPTSAGTRAHPAQAGHAAPQGIGMFAPVPSELLVGLLSSRERPFDVLGGNGPAALRLRRLTAGVLASLGAAFAAGLWPASLAGPNGAADTSTAITLLPMLRSVAFLCLAGAAHDADGTRAHAWRRVLLAFRPFELLAAILHGLVGGSLETKLNEMWVRAAVAVVAVVPEEARAAARAAAGEATDTSPLMLQVRHGIAGMNGRDTQLLGGLSGGCWRAPS
jgi:hypothetical protein